MFRRHALPSIRSKLVTLVLACALPILVGYLVFARDAARQEHAHIERDAATLAEALAAAVDRELENGQTAAKVMANSPLLANGDLAAFHANARMLLRPEFPVYAFVLSGADGRTLLHTRYAYGPSTPSDGNEAEIRRVFASGDTVTSGLHRADPSQPFVFSVVVPVWKDGKVEYALSVLLRPKRLGDLLAAQHLPEDWNAELFDSRQLMVARNIDLTRHIGERMRRDLTALGKHNRTGVVPPPASGEDINFAAFAHTADGWTVTVDFPPGAASELLGRSPGAILLWVGALLLITLGGAWRIGGSIARAVRALTSPAAALGRGEPLVIPPLPIREAAAVANALRKVEGELVGYRTRLESLVAARTAELAHSNLLLETVYGSAPVGLCFMDHNLRFVMVNDYLATLNALPTSEHIGHTLPELLGELGIQFEEPYRRVLETGRPLLDFESTGEVPRAPGMVRHWIASYYPAYSKNGELAGINAVVLDITERKREEQRNRDNEEMFRALYERSGDAHMMVAYGGGYVSANPATLVLFGYDSIDEFLTLTPLSTSPEFQSGGVPSDELCMQYMRRALATGSAHFEWVHQRRDGSTFHADVMMTSVDIGGKVMMQVTVRDISERVAAEAALRAAGERLAQASRVKGEFLANMSHEIRTPMNAILGLARLLEESGLPRRESGYVARMKTAARSLLAMLNDVLDFSRVEAGQLTLEHTCFRLEDVLHNIAVLTASNAWDKGVEPVFAIAPGVPPQLVGDPTRLEQVLLNLVGNAIKFTEQGEVVLSVRAQPLAHGQVELAFAVRDTGVGIPSDQQQRMFEAFTQGDSSTSRKYGGAGLGLAIARRLVEMMGGSLEVSSAPGRGSQFSFSIVLDSVPLEQALPASGLTVLVADDNDSACAALAEACAGFGWQVDRAGSGSEALALLRGERRYDLAFIDSAMPDLDGVTVLSYARADQAIDMPRCALLAADPERERLTALAPDLHLDAILGKPVTPGALLQAIFHLRGEQPRAAQPAVKPLARRLAGISVLLVEDNLINQEVANYILIHAGAAVDIAANGQAALSMLAEGERYDAVLMDLQMPVMSGFDAAAAIRAMGLFDLPIVAMTANASDEDRQRTLAAGMNAHLAKPLDVDELVDTLARLCALPSPACAPQTALADPAPASIPGIDLKATLPRFGGSFASFAALLKRLESSQGGTLDEVRAMLRRSDRQGAAQLVHRLRGVAANLGATDVAALALELEQALRSADDAALAVRLARLDSALQVVLDAARELQANAPAATLAVAPGAASPAPHTDLVRLLELLRTNNLKAMAQFDALRPALELSLAAQENVALAEAVETLRFDTAASLVQQILDRKTDA
ncbi:response regulator [Massilia horti]|uniref:Virulence sensor protein BvgS n=1 Tax=Massilia horti TaxID=2562153 RepID=A0A4Y9SW58_9BURK|nr:response regulator [Massilia horti]